MGDQHYIVGPKWHGPLGVGLLVGRYKDTGQLNVVLRLRRRLGVILKTWQIELHLWRLVLVMGLPFERPSFVIRPERYRIGFGLWAAGWWRYPSGAERARRESAHVDDR